MQVLKPTTRASRLPIQVMQLVAQHSTPNEVLALSHLSRRFRQELTKATYWQAAARELRLQSDSQPFQEYLKTLADNQQYINDPDCLATLPVKEQSQRLRFIVEYHHMNANRGESAHKADIQRTSLARQLTSDAMSQVRSVQSPKLEIEALEALDELSGFTSLWVDHMIGVYMGSVDMSSLDPYVYYQGDQFHSDKFEIFLRQLEKQVRTFSEEIRQFFPLSVYKETWEALVQRLDNEVLYKLTNYLCEINIDFVPSIFTCLQTYIHGILHMCPDSSEKFIGATFAPWVEKCIHHQAAQFRETAGARVAEWKQHLEQDEQATEQFLWSNVTRTGEKTNFLSSFKRALWVADNSQDQETDAAESTIDSITSPKTETEAQLALVLSKVKNIQGLLNLELVMGLIELVRHSFVQLRKFSVLEGQVAVAAQKEMRTLYVDLLQIAGMEHTQTGFNKAIDILNMYNPKKHRQVIVQSADGADSGDDTKAVEPLALFAELINVSDLMQQTLHVFFQQELVAPKIVDPNDFASSVVNTKRKFEQMLDDKVAEGLNRGVDVLIDQIDFVFMTEQLGSDFNPFPGAPAELGPTTAAKDVISLVKTHIGQLSRSLEKYVLEVFEVEVGMRLWNSICKHIKRSTISIEGAITLISDVNYYHAFVLSLKQKQLYPYYDALKQVSQLYLISPEDGKQLGNAISDMNRFRGVLPPDELVEFMKRRQDWPRVRNKVEKVLYGFGECVIC